MPKIQIDSAANFVIGNVGSTLAIEARILTKGFTPVATPVSTLTRCFLNIDTGMPPIATMPTDKGARAQKIQIPREKFWPVIGQSCL